MFNNSTRVSTSCASILALLVAAQAPAAGDLPPAGYLKQSTWHETLRVSRPHTWLAIENQKTDQPQAAIVWQQFWQTLRHDFPELDIQRYSETIHAATRRSVPADAVMIHVATDGDDTNPGTADAPFKTLHAARDAIRRRKRQDGGLKQPVRVLVHGGTYRFTAPLVLGPDDSGTAACPIVYEAAPGEQAVLSAGRLISTPWKCDDGKVFFTDIPAARSVPAPDPEKPSVSLHFQDKSGIKTTGAWRTSNYGGLPPYLVAAGTEAREPGTAAAVTFAPDVPESGHYRVFLDGAPFDNRSTQTPVEILHADGSASVSVDQRRPDPWTDLGTYRFEAGRKGHITVSTDGADGYVVARQVRLVKVDPAWRPAWRFRQLFVNGRRQTLARYPNFDATDVREKGWLYAADLPVRKILIGLARSGDFVEYRFTAPAQGRYALWIGYCTIHDRPQASLTLKIDGRPVPLAEMTPSGGWRDVKFVEAADVELQPGAHTLRLENTSGAGQPTPREMRFHLDAFLLSDNPRFRIEDERPSPPLADEHRICIQAEDETARVAGASSIGFDTRDILAEFAVDRILVEPGVVRPAWETSSQAEVFVFATWGWYNEIARLKSIQRGVPMLAGGECAAMADVLHLEGKQLRTDILPGNRFFIFNVREELDEPGEWFLDYESGRLGYWPTGGTMEDLEVTAPAADRILELKAPLESDRRVEHVTFRGFTFEHTDYTTDRRAVRSTPDSAVLLENCWHCSVEDCSFRNIGGYAVRLHLDSCLNRIAGNTVVEGGAGGILLTAAEAGWPGTRVVMTPGPLAGRYAPIGNLIEANEVHHCGRYLRYNAGVHTESRPPHMAQAPGNVYARNHIHHLPRNGIFCFARQGGHVIEYNHLHDLLLESDDGGAIHICALDQPEIAASLVCNNLIRDIIGYRYRRQEYTNAHGVYLDGATSNVRIRGNVIANTRKGCLFYHLGRNNVAENNILAGDRRAQVWIAKDWQGNIFRRNIVVWSSPDVPYWLVHPTDRGWKTGEPAQFDHNLLWHSGRPIHVELTQVQPWFSEAFGDNTTVPLEAWQAAGFERHSIVADPRFIDPSRPELGLKPDSPAFQLGFEPIGARKQHKDAKQ